MATRFEMRRTNQFTAELNAAMEDISGFKTESSLVRYAVIDYLSNPGNFEHCPECGRRISLKTMVHADGITFCKHCGKDYLVHHGVVKKITS